MICSKRIPLLAQWEYDGKVLTAGCLHVLDLGYVHVTLSS